MPTILDELFTRYTNPLRDSTAITPVKSTSVLPCLFQMQEETDLRAKMLGEK